MALFNGDEQVRIDCEQLLHVALSSYRPGLQRLLAAIGSSGARGLIVTPSPFASTNRDRLIKFAASGRLPAMYFIEDFADAGGLMAYGPSIADSYRRGAAHVDKILKGAKPGDLPVEQPTKFELIVNLRSARALGLQIPQSVCFVPTR